MLVFNTSLLLQGTSADQDNRFSDKEKKLLNSMRFEESLAKKVDMKKVSDSPYIIYSSCFPKTFSPHPSMSCIFGIVPKLFNFTFNVNQTQFTIGFK